MYEGAPKSMGNVPTLLFNYFVIGSEMKGWKDNDINTQAKHLFYEGNREFNNGLAFKYDFKSLNNAFKHFNKSLEHYNEAIKLVSDSPTLFKCKGDTLFELGRYSDAIEEYLKAIDIEPNFIEAWGHLSLSYLELNENNNSTAALSKAERLCSKIPSGTPQEDIPDVCALFED
jgi:tetratricopeptide (TPR) repeat protein